MNKNTLLKRNIGKSPIISYILNHRGIIIANIFLIIVGSILSSRFLSLRNIINVFNQCSLNMCLCFAMTLCLISGSIDLSVGVVALSASITFVGAMKLGFPIYVAILAAFALAAFAGALNGFLISKVGIVPFVATLGVQYIMKGYNWLISNQTTVSTRNEDFLFLARYKIGNLVPLTIPAMILLGILLWILLEKTKFGMNIFAVGGNRAAATASGVNVRNVLFMVHILSGVIAAIGGILLALRISSATPRTGEEWDGDAIGSAVIGGVSFMGGTGSIGGAFLGCLFFSIVSNMMNTAGVQDFLQSVIKGVIIVGAVSIDALSHLKKA